MPVVPERLKKSRIERGLSQEELAEKVGAGQNQISRYETGKSTPSVELLERIASVLNVSVDYLLGLVDVPNAEITEADLTDDERALVKAYRRGDLVKLLRSVLVRAEDATR